MVTLCLPVAKRAICALSLVDTDWGRIHREWAHLLAVCGFYAPRTCVGWPLCRRSSKVKPAAVFNMIVPAGKATPQLPVGSALGQRGLKLMDFCKAFNDQTSIYKEGVPIQVRVKSYADRTFTFDTFTPATSYFLLKAAGSTRAPTAPVMKSLVRSLSSRYMRSRRSRCRIS